MFSYVLFFCTPPTFIQASSPKIVKIDDFHWWKNKFWLPQNLEFPANRRNDATNERDSLPNMIQYSDFQCRTDNLGIG